MSPISHAKPEFTREPPPPRHGSAFLIVLVALSAVFSLLSLVQFQLGRRRAELRMDRARVELDGALLLGVERGMRLWEAGGESAEVFGADNGAEVRLQLLDMQSHLDVNSLLRAEALQEPFLRVLRAFERDLDRASLDEWIREGRPLADLREWPRALPQAAEWLREDGEGSPERFLTALPLPALGVNRVNLNTVDPALLLLLAGRELRGWADAVVAMREEEPLQSAEAVLSLLPPPVAATLSGLVAVDSQWMMLLVEAEYDYTVRRGRYLLTRTTEGWIEVFACR